MSSTCVDVMYFNVADSLLFSFPFPLPLSSIVQFHCYKHTLHLRLYKIMLAFVCMFIFWICLSHMKENM
jgi:hypothetical protein